MDRLLNNRKHEAQYVLSLDKDPVSGRSNKKFDLSIGFDLFNRRRPINDKYTQSTVVADVTFSLTFVSNSDTISSRIKSRSSRRTPVR
jgi:hypothetical protein